MVTLAHRAGCSWRELLAVFLVGLCPIPTLLSTACCRFLPRQSVTIELSSLRASDSIAF